MEQQFKKIDHYYFDPTSKPLGKGAFGTVYKAKDERTGVDVAVKVVPAAKLSEGGAEQLNLFMREIQVLQQIKGTHIVCLLDVKQTPNNLYIFTDFCDGGDLEGKLKQQKSYPEDEACSILKQIADAFVTIENMHIRNSAGHTVTMMHRDIKSANILFHQGRIKVADFGFAKFIDEAQKNTKQKNTLLGTPLYMAPQILNDDTYSTKCDIWSTGVLFYELLFGKLPWTGHSVPNLYQNIRTKPLTFPTPIRADTQDLVSRMLKANEEERLTWKEVFNHPALNHVDISGFRQAFDSLNIGGTPTHNYQQNSSPTHPSGGFSGSPQQYGSPTHPSGGYSGSPQQYGSPSHPNGGYGGSPNHFQQGGSPYGGNYQQGQVGYNQQYGSPTQQYQGGYSQGTPQNLNNYNNNQPHPSYQQNPY